jgi:hypothetical protein
MSSDNYKFRKWKLSKEVVHIVPHQSSVKVYLGFERYYLPEYAYATIVAQTETKYLLKYVKEHKPVTKWHSKMDVVYDDWVPLLTMAYFNDDGII